MIHTASRPIDVVLMEFYTRALPHSMDMWVKIAKKYTLRETFDETIKVEKEMSILGTNPKSREKKDHHPPKKIRELS